MHILDLSPGPSRGERLVTITLYLQTHTLTVQGNRHQDWFITEFPWMRDVVNQLTKKSQDPANGPVTCDFDVNLDSGNEISDSEYIICVEQADTNTNCGTHTDNGENADMNSEYDSETELLKLNTPRQQNVSIKPPSMTSQHKKIQGNEYLHNIGTMLTQLQQQQTSQQATNDERWSKIEQQLTQIQENKKENRDYVYNIDNAIVKLQDQQINQQKTYDQRFTKIEQQLKQLEEKKTLESRTTTHEQPNYN